MLSKTGLKKLKNIRSWVQGAEEGHIFEMVSPSQCVIGQYTEYTNGDSRSLRHHFPNDADAYVVRDLFAYDSLAWSARNPPPMYKDEVTREQWLAECDKLIESIKQYEATNETSSL